VLFTVLVRPGPPNLDGEVSPVNRAAGRPAPGQGALLPVMTFFAIYHTVNNTPWPLLPPLYGTAQTGAYRQVVSCPKETSQRFFRIFLVPPSSLIWAPRLTRLTREQRLSQKKGGQTRHRVSKPAGSQQEQASQARQQKQPKLAGCQTIAVVVATLLG